MLLLIDKGVISVDEPVVTLEDAVEARRDLPDGQAALNDVGRIVRSSGSMHRGHA